MQDDVYKNPKQANEIAIPQRLLIDHLLKAWAARWMILGDGRVGCVACEAAQSVSDARTPFLHEDGCRFHGDVVQQPWIFLRDYLAHIPQEQNS